MGAQRFFAFRQGKEADKLFWDAVRQAGDDDGNNGSTGTIAEKAGFILRSDKMFTLSEAKAFAVNDAEENNKWDHAFALTVKFDESDEVRGFLFYGYAPD